jgi:hypothetical protein
MSSYQNIKRFCTIIAKYYAPDFFAGQMSRETTGRPASETNPFIEKEKEINEMLHKRELFGVQGSSQGGTVDKKGKWVEFLALVQTFNRDAPELKKILNKACGSFYITKEADENYSVTASGNGKPADLINIANYFITSEETYALDKASKEIIQLNCRQKASANKTDYGVVFEWNVETIPSVDTIAPNLVTIKLPAGPSPKNTVIIKISKEVANELNKQGFNDMLNDQKLKDERTKAVEAFETLDKDLEEFLKA